jgi:glucose-6-phosphate-specific signal transduction histidine kinase
MKKPNVAYWICQIAGWGGYTAVGLITAVADSGWRPSVVIGYLLFFLYSIGLTHLLRSLARRRKWLSLPAPRALLRFAAASIAMGAIQTPLVVGIYTAIEGGLGVWSERSASLFMFLGVTTVDCIWSILYVAVTSVRQSRETRQNEMQLKLALSNAELRALEAQLNPHFLFNCLNSLRAMIGEDENQARDMVTRLANILRYNLQRERPHTVPLASEVEIVSDYLALESVRFEDRLRFRVDIDDSSQSASIPPMLLQTLVENAIKHGVEETASRGELVVRARTEDGSLRIEVENPGTLAEAPAGSTQIGLANARERLRILYGDRASINLGANRGGFVTATIVIPAAA